MMNSNKSLFGGPVTKLLEDDTLQTLQSTFCEIYNSKKHSRTICHLAKHLLKLCHCWQPLCAALMVLGI